ncbi:MAG: zinc ribbon domain-containing protein [Duganella sp.]
MTSLTLICPQCGAPLPAQARWRTVQCQYCHASVTPKARVVQAAAFHAAYQRSLADHDGASRIECCGQHYRILNTLGHGASDTPALSSRVLLAQRLGALPERVILKLQQAGADDKALIQRQQQEMAVLRRLQAATDPGAAYFSQRLPQPVAQGRATGNVGAHGLTHTHALIVRNPVGYWGSLADVLRHTPQGVDARHVVWMWRRVLEVLGHVHASGWAHTRVAPEHLLVHPADHGILIIGWSQARSHSDSSLQARDLMQLAWSMRCLLHGGVEQLSAPPIAASVPAPLASLLERASEDANWCATHGAAGIDSQLKAAAQAAFGPPRFLHFNPTINPR